MSAHVDPVVQQLAFLLLGFAILIGLALYIAATVIADAIREDRFKPLRERVIAITSAPLARAEFIAACLEDYRPNSTFSKELFEQAASEERAIAKLLDNIILSGVPR